MFKSLPKSSLFPALAAATALLATQAAAQVNGEGPSDPGDFDTVINVPADQASIGGFVDSDPGETTQLNLSDGGTIEAFFDVLGTTELNITGGVVENNVETFSNTEVNISGGTIGNNFFSSNSLVTITGGSFGSLSNGSNSLFQISGGTFSSTLGVDGAGRVEVSGGTFDGVFQVGNQGQLAIIGTNFALDGAPVTGLVLDVETEITDRDSTLTGLLEDGTPFDIVLGNNVNVPGEDTVGTGAVLTVTRVVPEPSSLVLLGVAGAALLARRRRV